MSKQHDGGPAFPHLSRIVAANIYEPISEGGMTLRDYFAAKAMQGLAVGVNDPAYEVIATMAYNMADAMLEARSVNTPPPPAKTITDAQIDAIANGMPGGLDGFLKGWGWRHFARAILAASNGEAAVPTPAQVQEGQ